MTRRTLKNLAVSLAVGAVLAASPLTSLELVPSVAIGLAAAAATFVWLRRSGPEQISDEPGAVSLPPLVVLVLLATVAVFAPTFRWLYESWTSSIWSNDHGIFIPPLVAFLAWRTLREDPRPEREESSAGGLWWIAAGLGLAVIDASVHTRYLSVLGFLLVLPGLSLATLGARRTRALAVPLAVSLLMMPIPRTFASDLFLRHLTAEGVEPIIRLLGYPVYLDLTVLHMPSGVFVVSNACSGFATLYASVAVAVILAAYARSHGERAVLLLSAVPLALAANVLRVVMLVLLTTWWGHWVIDSPLHEGSGVATFAVVLVCLFAISSGFGSRRPVAAASERAT